MTKMTKSNFYIHALSTKSQACLKFIDEEYELSIAFDDSCGAMENLGRASSMIFKNDRIYSEEVSHYGDPKDFLRTLADFFGYKLVPVELQELLKGLVPKSLGSGQFVLQDENGMDIRIPRVQLFVDVVPGDDSGNLVVFAHRSGMAGQFYYDRGVKSWFSPPPAP